MALAEKFEETETAVQVLVIGTVGYLIYKLLTGSVTAFTQLAAATAQDVNDVKNINQAVGKPGTLNAIQAETIAGLLQPPGQPYSQSPDGTQVWFPNGVYYDNPTGKVYNPDGSVVGPFLESDGTVNPAASLAVVGGPTI